MNHVIEMKVGQAVRLGKRTQTNKPLQLGIVYGGKSVNMPVETIATEGFWGVADRGYVVDSPLVTLVKIDTQEETPKRLPKGAGEIHGVYADGVFMGDYRVYYIQHYQVHWVYGFSKADNQAGDGERV